jgi:hypothetical protein
MKRLDQGHPHPKLEVPGLTCPGQELNPGLRGGSELSRKEPFEQLVTIWNTRAGLSARPVENARDSIPSVS